MSNEAAVPGMKLISEQLQMICCRYYIAAQYAQNKRVLEVGCGIGMGLGYLSRTARRVVGGDYSEENLGYARQHYGGRVELLLLDALALPFNGGSFGVVVATEVIEYLPRPNDFFRECYHVLGKNGVLILCLPNKDAPGFHKSPLSFRYYSVPELFGLLSRQGFNVEISGAFPITRRSTWERVRAEAIVDAGRMLDAAPGGKKVKGFLNSVVLGKTIGVKSELTDSDMAAGNFELVPVPSGYSDYRHRILYAIARKR